MIRRTLVAAVLLAIIATVGYDTWLYATAQRELRDSTYDIARWAAENRPGLTKQQAASEVAKMANKRGVTVYRYDQTDRGVRIWAQATVDDTLVFGTVAGLLRRESFRQAMGAPLVIRDYREAGIP